MLEISAYKAADRVVEDGEGETLLRVVDDAEFAGTLPRPQRLVQPGPRRLEMPLQRIDDVLWILAAGEPGLEDDGVLDDDLVLPRKVLDPPAQCVEPGFGRLDTT